MIARCLDRVGRREVGSRLRRRVIRESVGDFC